MESKPCSTYGRCFPFALVVALCVMLSLSPVVLAYEAEKDDTVEGVSSFDPWTVNPEEDILCEELKFEDLPTADVWVNSNLVFRLRGDLGNFTVAERCDAITRRLHTLLTEERDLIPEIQAEVRDGKAVVAAGPLLLATVGQAAAEANNTDAEVVAWVWANKLREAFGLEPLAADAIPVTDPFAQAEPVAWVASWYGDRFKGRRTASGETFDPGLLTAAHPNLPFGTLLRVTDPASGRQVVVRVNDRGPFVQGRHLDLSAAAASEVGLISKGVGTVLVEVLQPS